MTEARERRGPETEYEGREYEATITFCLKEEATVDQLWDWLEFELGGGSIASDHPLVSSGAYLRRVSVTDLRDRKIRRYVDWEAEKEDGSRSGRGRAEYDR